MYLQSEQFEDKTSACRLDRDLNDRILKSKKVNTCLEVRPHEFPELSEGQFSAEDWFQRRTAAFKADAFHSIHETVDTDDGLSQVQHTEINEQPSGSSISNKTPSLQFTLEQVQQVVFNLELITKQMDQKLESVLGVLSLGLAKVMISQTVETTPEIVLESLSKALNLSQGHKVRRIRLNKTDHETVVSSKDRLSGKLDQVETLQLEIDNSVGPGGCVVETEYGTIDATLENQFQVLINRFNTMMEITQPK